MAPRTDTQPVAGQQHHTRRQRTARILAAITIVCRWIELVMRACAAVAFVVLLLGQSVAQIKVGLLP